MFNEFCLKIEKLFKLDFKGLFADYSLSFVFFFSRFDFYLVILENLEVFLEYFDYFDIFDYTDIADWRDCKENPLFLEFIYSGESLS